MFVLLNVSVGVDQIASKDTLWHYWTRCDRITAQWNNLFRKHLVKDGWRRRAGDGGAAEGRPSALYFDEDGAGRLIGTGKVCADGGGGGRGAGIL